jgi:glucokinase
MTNQLIMVADVGGTNTRFALANSDGIIAHSVARYANNEVEGFVEAAQSYLSSLDGQKPTSLCTAIAGPVSEGKGKLTNGNWVFDTQILAEALGLKNAYLLNDLAALGYAVAVLPDEMVTQIGGGAPYGKQALVAGIATGFNVSLSHDGHVAEAEVGHASLPSSVTGVLREAMGEQAFDFKTVEGLFSGSGLSALHSALGCEAQDPAQITMSDGATVKLAAKALGVFARELTYQYMPLAGLYFNGSVARGILGSSEGAQIVANEVGKDDAFLGRFGQVPMFLITEDSAALFGCAHYAQIQSTS